MALAVTRTRRALAASGIAALTALWFAWGIHRQAAPQTDFDQLWFAARAILRDHDPYPLIGPGRAFEWSWPWYYPLAGALPALPFAWLQLPAARIAYVFAMAWCFAYLIARDGWHRLVACMSGAYLAAMSLAQWSPWMACALIEPRWFGWVVSGKPNLGAMVVGASESRRAVIWYAGWGLGLLVVSFLLVPHWLTEWRAALASASHIRPYVLRPFGWLLLLGLLRCREPAARWLAVLAVIPTSVGVADALTLFAFRHTFRQGLILALLTHAVGFYIALHVNPRAPFDHIIEFSATVVLWLVWLPALACLLISLVLEIGHESAKVRSWRWWWCSRSSRRDRGRD